MADTAPIDLASLRRSCGHCSLRQLCLPANIGVDDMARLDDVVRRRRPLKRDERLFHHGDVLTSVYVARSGAFKTVSLSEGGDERIIGFHLPGELMGLDALADGEHRRSEEHTSELQSLMRISYAVFCCKKKKNT